MGRTQSLAEWIKPSTGSEYLNQRDANSKFRFSEFPLTALGYGEPSFAAYYPNSYSVFGFCDVDPDLKGDSCYEYQLVGWIHEADLDPLQSSQFADLPNDAARFDAVEREYKEEPSKTDRAK